MQIAGLRRFVKGGPPATIALIDVERTNTMPAARLEDGMDHLRISLLRASVPKSRHFALCRVTDLVELVYHGLLLLA